MTNRQKFDIVVKLLKLDHIKNLETGDRQVSLDKVLDILTEAWENEENAK